MSILKLLENDVIGRLDKVAVFFRGEAVYRGLAENIPIKYAYLDVRVMMGANELVLGVIERR